MNDTFCVQVANRSKKLPREYFDSNYGNVKDRLRSCARLVNTTGSVDHLRQRVRVQRRHDVHISVSRFVSRRVVIV